MLDLQDKDGNTLKVIKGRNGIEIETKQAFLTPFGVQFRIAKKFLTEEDAMKLRDFLDESYPIKYDNVIDVEFHEVLEG